MNKILKFANTFGDLVGLESALWDGSPPAAAVEPTPAPQPTPTSTEVPGYTRLTQTPGQDVQHKSYELSERSRQKISELQPPEFQEQVRQLILRGLQEGLRPEIVEGYRSQERQNELYEQGRTKPGDVVTQTRSSMHTQRMAVDIAQLDEQGKITYNPDPPDFWDRMGAIGRSLGLNWGGDWSGFKDRPHFQYKTKR